MKLQLNGTGQSMQGYKEEHCEWSSNLSVCPETQTNCQAGMWQQWVGWLLLSHDTLSNVFEELIVCIHKLERKKKKSNSPAIAYETRWKEDQKSKKSNKIFGMWAHYHRSQTKIFVSGFFWAALRVDRTEVRLRIGTSGFYS